jgi:hypothetical protein
MTLHNLYSVNPYDQHTLGSIKLDLAFSPIRHLPYGPSYLYLAIVFS